MDTHTHTYPLPDTHNTGAICPGKFLFRVVVATYGLEQSPRLCVEALFSIIPALTCMLRHNFSATVYTQRV
jgi:hypothetical protein